MTKNPSTENATDMDRKLKTKWLRALRSGKFPQQRNSVLKDDVGYCCLGVLCEVGHIRSASETYIKSKVGGYRVLPQAVQEDLAQMNDSGKRFRSIAKWIEKNL